MSMTTFSRGSQRASHFTPAEMQARMLHRRAVEAALWGMPLVNFDAMRQAYFRDAGAEYNDILYWSKPSDWKYQTATPNNSTNYIMFFVNLKDGPIVVDIPATKEASLLGSLVDSWNFALADVGDAGQDNGQGGRYLLIPPDHRAQPAPGYIAIHSTTYNVYSLLRVIPRTHNPLDLAKALDYVKKIQVHPLWQTESSHHSELIDMAGKRFEAIAPYDASFYASLARMVAEEPVKTRDITMMGELHSLGIGKGLTYRPDVRTLEIFERAIAEAHAYMVEGWRHAGFEWWPNRKWRFPVGEDVIKTGGTFIADERVLLDERAFNFFGAFGMSRYPQPNLYVMTFEDSRGELLNGGSTYRLRVPADVPTKQFWSVVAYDTETAAFIREAPVVGLDSYNPKLEHNPDGSVDFYFAPQPPRGHASNWISTMHGRQFFVVFRNYAPEKTVLERTSAWTLNDIELVG
ncbi:MAG: DUF1254 domain-containing protein [Kofleriaceae bacterium]|nr:DUF1254 domain-containing protein [Kofleriaceae bacterium]